MAEGTIPPPSGTVPVPSTVPTTPVPVVVQEVPPQIAKLIQQAQLELLAKIVWQKPDGTALLQTPKGDVTVKTEIPLPVNSRVPVTFPLQAASAGADVREIFLSLPRAALPQSAIHLPSLPASTSTTPALTPAAPPPLPPLLPGGLVTALPLNPTGAFIPTLARPLLPLNLTLTLPPENLPLQSLSGLVRAIEPLVKDAVLRINQTFIPSPAAPARATSSPAQPAVAVPTRLAQTLLNLQETESPLALKASAPALARADAPTPVPQFFTLQRILPAPAPSTSASSPPGQALPPAPQQLIATVNGSTLTGQAIVTVPERGIFVLQSSTHLPPGTQLVLEPAAAPQAQTPIQPNARPVVVIPTPEGDVVLPVLDPVADAEWPVLDEVLQSLSQTSPQTAAALRAALPTPATPAQLPAATLFFLSAMKSGILENWIGPAQLDSLRQSGRQGLIDALRGDVSRITRTASEVTPSGEWRVLSMPMNHDNQISQVQIFVRHQPYEHAEREGDGKDETREKKQTRFVLSFGLNRLGPMQLDGLLRRKTLDLIVRTDKALNPDMRQEIRKRFASGLEQVNLTGEIAFHSDKKGWVLVETPPPRAGITA